MSLDFCFSSLPEPIAYNLSRLPAVPPHSFPLLDSSIIIFFGVLDPLGCASVLEPSAILEKVISRLAAPVALDTFKIICELREHFLTIFPLE